jgi:hypothetical protein
MLKKKQTAKERPTPVAIDYRRPRSLSPKEKAAREK